MFFSFFSRSIYQREVLKSKEDLEDEEESSSSLPHTSDFPDSDPEDDFLKVNQNLNFITESSYQSYIDLRKSEEEKKTRLLTEAFIERENAAAEVTFFILYLCSSI